MRPLLQQPAYHPLALGVPANSICGFCLLKVHGGLCLCEHAHMHMEAVGRYQILLELVLKAVVSHLKYVPGSELRASGRIASTLNPSHLFGLTVFVFKRKYFVL